MNTYYLPIFKKLGYRPLNPNQSELHLLDKDTGELIKKVDGINDYVFCDDKRHTKIKYDKALDKYTVFINDKPIIDFGHQDEGARDCCIFRTLINVKKEVWARIYVEQKPLDKNIPSCTVTVEVIKYPKPITFTIKQYYFGAVLNWSNEKETKKIQAKDCTVDNYLKGIISFLELNCFDQNQNNYSDNNLREGLDLINDGLTESIKDIVDYWKNVVLPDGIKREKARLAELEQKNSLTPTIEFIRNEIKELEDVQGNYIIYTYRV